MGELSRGIILFLLGKDMNDYIKELGELVQARQMTWKEVAREVNIKFNQNLSANAVRKRYSRMEKPRVEKMTVQTEREYETLYGDGTIEAQKLVELSPEDKASPAKVLQVMGYNANEWELLLMQFSNWEQHTKSEGTKSLYAVKFKLKPIAPEIDLEESLEIAKQVYAKEIKPLKLAKLEPRKNRDNNLLLECPGIELHLGKLAWHGETGENYDYKIARKRFEKIIEEIIKTQDMHKVGNMFMSIGNDFFNTDTITYTTTKGTPQSNDVRWQKMFLTGLQLYKEGLLTLREHFNKININLVAGNHDEMATFYLYIALKQFFSEDNVIKFSDNIKKTQCFRFGNNAIFTSHGDKNLKRLIRSIPAEFAVEWGESTYRELHLGHLHKEVVVDDESGLITRRVGSPSGLDDWHYNERYIGATPRHQLFLWDKNDGLIMSRYITFKPEKKLF